MQKTLSKRVQKEINDAMCSTSFEFFYDEAGILGLNNACYLRFVAECGAYAGQTHILRIKFSYGNGDHNYEFPRHPPSVKFETPIWHPNVGMNGTICVDVLQSKWSPIMGIHAVYNAIVLLLEHPNPDSPLNQEAGNQLGHRNPDHVAFAACVVNHYNNASVRAKTLLHAECWNTKKNTVSGEFGEKQI